MEERVERNAEAGKGKVKKRGDAVEIESGSQLILGKKVIEPPYFVRKFGVSEEEYEEFTDEDTKAELFDGTLIIHSPASIRHEDIFGFLYFLMRGYAEHKQLGKVLGSRATMHLGPCRLFEPDILFVRSERLSILRERRLEGVADLVVEILSPWTRNYDMQEKRLAYHSAGVEELWFVDDEARNIVVDRRRRDGKYRTSTVRAGKVESEVMQGFFVLAEWLWAEVLPEPFACLRKILRESERG